MNTEENNSSITRLVPQMYDQDPSLADKIFAPGCIHHMNGIEQNVKGPACIRASVEELHQDFSNSRTEIVDLISSADKVAFRWTWQAIRKDSGIPFTMQGNTIFHFHDDKVSEAWAIDDRFQVMLSMGFQIIPPQTDPGQ